MQRLRQGLDFVVRHLEAASCQPILHWRLFQEEAGKRVTVMTLPEVREAEFRPVQLVAYGLSALTCRRPWQVRTGFPWGLALMALAMQASELPEVPGATWKRGSAFLHPCLSGANQSALSAVGPPASLVEVTLF